MSVRENIIRLRTLSMLTQEEFGKIAGVSRGAVSQWEGGFSEPRMGAIERLAKHFGIPKSWLIEDYGMNGVIRDSNGRYVMQDGTTIERFHYEDDAINDQLGQLAMLFTQLDDESRILVLGFVQGLLTRGKQPQ